MGGRDLHPLHLHLGCTDLNCGESVSAVYASQLQRHRGSAVAAELQLVSSETSQAGWAAAGSPLRTCPDTDENTVPDELSVGDATVAVKWRDEGDEIERRRDGDEGTKRCKC